MKIRVYEIARKLNTKSSIIIKKLNDKGIEAKSNFSGIEENKANEFIRNWNKSKAETIKDIKTKRLKKEETPKDKQTDQKAVKSKTKPQAQTFKHGKRVNLKKEKFIESVTPQMLKAKKKYKKVEKVEKIEEESNKLQINEGITVHEFTQKLGVDLSDIIAKLFELGMLVRKNDIINFDAAKLIAEEYGFEISEGASEQKVTEGLLDIEDKEEDLIQRPPIVTVMGHVDHGKTSILDAIKKTNIASREAGGITQHMGAYTVKLKDKYITFLDTPGHEAFTSMRARGAQITDIVVLVVAADDGVMPQTIEAIDHSKAAGVPIVVAVNKIDKPNANPEKAKKQLSNYGVIPEDWGGDNIFTNVSAKKLIGMDDLLESILLQADVMELKANPNKRAKAVVVEARLDKNKGHVATVVVKEGTLKIGDVFIVGAYYGKVRALINNRGAKVKEVKPSFSIDILGLHGVPEAGDTLIVVKDEQTAKAISSKRQEELRQSALSKHKISLQNVFDQIDEGKLKKLPVILKTDVYGSIEAIESSLLKISTEEVSVEVIHSGVGAITESDINLADASNAIIIGFNVRPTQEALKMSKDLGIEIRNYGVIYEIINDIKKSLSGLLDPTEEEEILGRLEIRDTFKVPKIGIVAGCYVTYGKITRSSKIRILRNGVILYEGKITSLKHFKDDVSEVQQGYECGVGIEGFNDIKAGDSIESYIINKIQREL